MVIISREVIRVAGLKPLTVTPFENADGEWRTIMNVITHQILPSLVRCGSRLFLPSLQPPGSTLQFLPLVDGFKVWRPRRQKLPEFIYLLSGKRYLWINGKWFVLTAGQGAFVPEQVEYFPFGMARGYPPTCDGVSLIVHPEGGILVRTRLTEVSYQRSVHFFIPEPSLMRRYEEWFQGLLSHSANEVIVELFELVSRSQPIGLTLISRCLVQAGKFPEVLQRALTFLHRAYNIPTTTSQIARYSFVSEAQLYRLFRQWLGMSPYDYLTNLRMQIAKEFLERTRLGIADIAFLVGYASRSMFSFNFRKASGLFPTALRYHKAHALNPFTAPMKFART